MSGERGKAVQGGGIGGGKGRILRWQYEVPLPEIPNDNYASVILDILSQHGNETAIVDANTGKSYTYSSLRSRVLKIRDGLLSEGIGLGDAVMLVSKNHMDFPVVILGLMLSGATCVPVNPSFTKDELTHIARISQAKWVIANEEITGIIKEAYKPLGPGALRQLWVIDGNAKGQPSLEDLISSGIPDTSNKSNEKFDSARSVAMMPFSSGTTGLPKGVMLTHRNLLTAYMQTKYFATLYEAPFNIFESTLLLLPMYHLYGFSMSFAVLISGGKIIVRTRFSPEEYFQTIEKYRVTYSPIVPYIVKFLLDTSLMEKYDLSSLMIFVSSSAPIEDKLLEALTEKTGKMAMQGYGMTEACANVAINSGFSGSKPNSIGRISPYFEAKVIDLETGEMLGEGEEGELCVRGPAVTLGYANNPEATAETIDSEGWLHTGDLFYYDEDDFLFITDRIKDLIKVKGYQVAPTEIENVLIKLNEVSDVAVTGVPHDRLGEAPRAWVVPTDGATIDPKKLMRHVADNLASYKQLAGGVQIVKSIPKNHLGKILRRQLRKSYLPISSKL